MGLGSHDKDIDIAASTAPPAPSVPDGLPEDFAPFFFLRDILSAADLSSMALKLVHKHLLLTGLPPELQATLYMIPETDQLRALIPDILEKLDYLRVVCEGALQASAADELSKHAMSFVGRASGDDDD